MWLEEFRHFGAGSHSRGNRFLAPPLRREFWRAYFGFQECPKCPAGWSPGACQPYRRKGTRGCPAECTSAIRSPPALSILATARLSGSGPGGSPS